MVTSRTGAVSWGRGGHTQVGGGGGAMMMVVRVRVARGHRGVGGAGAIAGGGRGGPIVRRGAVGGCWPMIRGRS